MENTDFKVGDLVQFTDEYKKKYSNNTEGVFEIKELFTDGQNGETTVDLKSRNARKDGHVKIPVKMLYKLSIY